MGRRVLLRKNIFVEKLEQNLQVKFKINFLFKVSKFLVHDQRIFFDFIMVSKIKGAGWFYVKEGEKNEREGH